MAAIRPTSTTLSTTEDVTWHEHCRNSGAHRYEPPLHTGRGTFCALAPELKQVAWSDRFRPRPIDKYDRSSKPQKFIQMYHTIIEGVGGDDRVKANYLPTALSVAVRSEAMFIGNFQGIYEHPSTTETLKTIK
jgi:hypothetical protein